MAVGLVVAPDGRLLLQHRDDRPGLPGSGKWGFFGGHVERGETLSGAFLRELNEELGWRPRRFEHFHTREVDHDDWHGTSHAFAAHLDVPLEALTLGEGQAMALFAPDALPSPSVPGVADVIGLFAKSDAYERTRRTYDVLTAVALLIDREGRFLLQHRDDKPGIENPGRWGSFGGAIEPYETPEEGFLREIEEELGWQPEAYGLYLASGYHPDERWVLVYVYDALVEVPEERLVLGEGQGMGFFAPGALPEETVPALRMLIAAYVRTARYEELLRA
ncbi:MAG: NUDIX domain-containing protein [Dehalococcoidia bacterium]